MKDTRIRVVLLIILGIIVLGAAQSSAAQVITSIKRHNSTCTQPEIVSPLKDGAVAFADRNHKYQSIPPALTGAEYIKVANEDKYTKDYELDLIISKPTILYLFLDNRLGHGSKAYVDGSQLNPNLNDAGMDWVDKLGFVDTGLDIVIREVGTGVSRRWISVYANKASPGQITLFQQNDGGSPQERTRITSRNMYGVAVTDNMISKAEIEAASAQKEKSTDSSHETAVTGNLVRQGPDSGAVAQQKAGTMQSRESKICDPAGKLEGLEWVKHGPVELRNGNFYVVEFWTTWCGPCVYSIPHLTKLQKKFADKKVSFVGISYETRDKIDPFVKKMGAKMDYAVARDPERKVWSKYMRAYKQRGIPCAFIVDKELRVVWVGHPMSDLDEVLEKVVEGKFDAKSYAAKKELESKKKEKLNTAFQEYFDAVKRDGGAKEAKAAAEIILENGSSGLLNAFAWRVLTEVEDGKQDLKAALRAAAKANKETEGRSAPILDTYALALFKNGMVSEAITMQQKALKLVIGKERIEKQYRARLDEFTKGSVYRDKGRDGEERELITVPNGGFEQVYKPGSTTITAELELLVGMGDDDDGWTQGVGPNTPMDSAPYIGTDRRYACRASYSDGTVGNFVDIPGWVGADKEGWIAYGGTYGRNTTTGNRQGSVSGEGGTPNGRYCYLANGGPDYPEGFFNPAGGLIVSDAPLATVESGLTYTVSMLARRRKGIAATPVVLDLLADGVALTSNSSVDPVLSDEWQEFSRTYDAASLSSHLGESLTIQLGVGRGASGRQTLFDAVSLSAIP